MARHSGLSLKSDAAAGPAGAAGNRSEERETSLPSDFFSSHLQIWATAVRRDNHNSEVLDRAFCVRWGLVPRGGLPLRVAETKSGVYKVCGFPGPEGKCVRSCSDF
jgi:hypothetical protein